MKLGILGGTFDPIHIGHLIVAQEAAAMAELDQILFIPTGQPWMKAGRQVSPAPQRKEMLDLALEGNLTFKVSTIEIDRPGPSYTVDTLTALRESDVKGAELFFILGMDSLQEIHRWNQVGRLFMLCKLVVVSRPGHADFNWESLEEIRSGALERMQFIEGPHIGVSGAEIRRRVSLGFPISYWVPRSVERYIGEKGLYKEARGE